MKLTIQFNDKDLKDAFQCHLETALPIQAYIVAALRYFDKARAIEKDGKIMGFGDKARFETYNTKLSTQEYIPEFDDNF